MQIKWKIFRIVFTIIICTLLVGILITAYVLKGKLYLVNIGFAYLGVYGLMLFLFLLCQEVMSLLNNNYWIPKIISHSCNKPKVGIQVVGYREDPVLFRGCLMSMAKQDYPQIERVIVGIDGNEEKDLLMQKAFETVFPEGLILRLDKIYQDMDQSQKHSIHSTLGNHKYVCVSQPHVGKVQIMYTAMGLHTNSTEFICLTDSDTFFQPNTVTEMVKVFDGYDEMKKKNPKIRECGAVTGDVQIWNKQNFISYQSYLRYWYGFHVERAAESFFSVVNCISGPLGLYRKSAIDEVKDRWVHSSFLGSKCTFGDDRHLTNLLLLKGMATLYTPYAKCKTDTPAQLLRWIAQQTRWCKSFYRQFLISIKAFHKQPIWLAFHLIFQIVVSFFIIVTLLWYVTISPETYCMTISMIVIMGSIRAIFGALRARRFDFLYSISYVVLYLLFLIPVKLWALITVWNNEWGTSNRLGRSSPILKAIHAIVWAVGFVAFYIAIGIKHVLNNDKIQNVYTPYIFYGCLGFLVFLFIHWLIYSNCYLIPKCKTQFQANKIQVQNQITKRRGNITEVGKILQVKNGAIVQGQRKQHIKTSHSTTADVTSSKRLILEPNIINSM